MHVRASLSQTVLCELSSGETLLQDTPNLIRTLTTMGFICIGATVVNFHFHCLHVIGIIFPIYKQCTVC